MKPVTPYFVYISNLTCLDANDPGNEDELLISSLGLKANGETLNRRFRLIKPCGAVSRPNNWYLWADKLSPFSTSSFIFSIFEEDKTSDGEDIIRLKLTAKANWMGKLHFKVVGLPIYADKFHNNKKKIGDTNAIIKDSSIQFEAKGRWKDGSSHYKGSLSINSEL